MNHLAIAIVALLLSAAALAWGQGNPNVPPDCFGANKALQYQGQWYCATITGATGPAGPPGPQGPQGPAIPAAPPPTQCITSNWNGAEWVCVPTNYLEAK